MGMNLISPWLEYYYEIEALFAKDPEVNVEYNYDAKEIKLRVSNHRKADALTALLPAEKTFGTVSLRVTVIPCNGEDDNREQLFHDAFDGNAALKSITKIDAFGGEMLFVEFVPEVVQYHNDDISDLHGNRSTIYADLAKDVFDVGSGVFFCTAPLL